MEIDISGLDKAEVLMALYDRALVQGLGILDARPGGLPKDEAEALLRSSPHFDYLHGRVMKVSLIGDSFDPGLYDRDNGQGAAARALEHLRKTNNTTQTQE